MRKVVFIIVSLIIIQFTSYEINAQIFRDISRVGTTVAPFLKIGAGARAVAMGSAYTAVSDDIYATYWNPAGIAVSKGIGQVAFNHTEWIADINYDYAAGAINVPGLGTMFMTFTSMSTPKEKVRSFDFPDGDGRTWDASSLSLGIGFARSLTDRFSIGFHAKFIRESIWNSSASGFALDVGTYYITPFNDLVIGASISNFGTKMKLDGRDIQGNIDPNDDPESGPNNIPFNYRMEVNDLPLNFKVGLAMDVYESRFTTIKVAIDAVHPNDNNEYVNTGVEFNFYDMFFIRGGYKTLFMPDSEQGLTAGAGLNYEISPGLKVVVNYAYGDFGLLKNIQYFDIGLTF
ncbi:MAG: PorV/PorQ family protein [Melioribacteraceae bacterium]|nr:PorV/PorQ family protein [Melioribacteraceae bacterium]